MVNSEDQMNVFLISDAGLYSLVNPPNSLAHSTIRNAYDWLWASNASFVSGRPYRYSAIRNSTVTRSISYGAIRDDPSKLIVRNQ